MSNVTNVILKTGTSESEAIDQLNYRFREGKGFVECDDEGLRPRWYAGDKALECAIYPGAFNYFDLDAFVECIKDCHWEYPNSVQLFIQEENSERLREVPLELEAR
jgi:hypothetical protein